MASLTTQHPKWMKSDGDRVHSVGSDFPYVKHNLPNPKQQASREVNVALLNSDFWYQFFNRIPIPNSNDWLADNCPGVKDRKGQSFRQYYRYIHLRYPKPNQANIGLQCVGNFNIKLNYFLKNNNENGNTNENENEIENKNDNDNKQNENDNTNDDDLKTEDSNDKTKNNNIQNNGVSLLEMLSEIVEYFYGMKVQIMDSISSEDITSRYNDNSNTTQLHTLDIHPRLKKIREQNPNLGLYCLMGVTMMDLYPKDSWNFAFGQAKIPDGVGIFSFARYFPHFYDICDLIDMKFVKTHAKQEDINKLLIVQKLLDNKLSNQEMCKLEIDKILNKQGQMIFFRRCIKVLVHEIGHLFGLKHCVYFACIMNGSNHLDESDAKPVFLCPICLHKVYFCRLMNFNNIKDGTLNILKRYQNLQKVYEKFGLIDEAKWYQSRVEFIQKESLSFVKFLLKFQNP